MPCVVVPTYADKSGVMVFIEINKPKEKWRSKRQVPNKTKKKARAAQNKKKEVSPSATFPKFSDISLASPL